MQYFYKFRREVQEPNTFSLYSLDLTEPSDAGAEGEETLASLKGCYHAHDKAHFLPSNCNREHLWLYVFTHLTCRVIGVVTLLLVYQNRKLTTLPRFNWEIYIYFLISIVIEELVVTLGILIFDRLH